ncbi:hypothetical protein [Ethanoligenens sp.]|uniref:hypothetical protein n=1 Tax=Ethanoligenens sp. TaxID=2099655 RepID=UPI0039E81F20
MPYISIVELNGKRVRYWVTKKLGATELKAMERFNADQKKEIERQRKADSRHRDYRSLDDLDHCSKNAILENRDLWIAVREVLSSCTQMQTERFLLFLHGYSNSEIARIQKCTNKAVEHSILDIFNKIKKFLI